MRKILFIDRDGTICREPVDEQVDRIDKVKLLSGVIPSLLTLQQQGYELVMVTNQDGLGTASFPQEDFDLAHNFLLELLASQGVIFTKILICPHLPQHQCKCRKPNIGLVLSYLQDPHWCRQSSAMIGDRDSDRQLAEAMNIRSFRCGDEASSDALGWNDICHKLLAMGRTAKLVRKTKETSIHLTLDLDRSGYSNVVSGIRFLDHLLEQLPKHGGFSLRLQCQGDLDIDDHHSVEDIAIALGQAFKTALGNKRGIQRYGFLLPMDDSQVKIALDLGGRPYFMFNGVFSRPHIGGLATEMVNHFFRSFAYALEANLHMEVFGDNDHHKIEALFKGLARTLRQAIYRDTSGELPSTKGLL